MDQPRGPSNRRVQEVQNSTQDNARFSWQMPVDLSPISQVEQPFPIPSTAQTQNQDRRSSAQDNARRPSENRFSYMRTPVEAQTPTFAQSNIRRHPSERDILGSPLTPIDNSPTSALENNAFEYPNPRHQAPAPYQRSQILSDKLAGDMPNAPYNLPPPRETHPAFHPATQGTQQSPPPTQRLPQIPQQHDQSLQQILPPQYSGQLPMFPEQQSRSHTPALQPQSRHQTPAPQQQSRHQTPAPEQPAPPTAPLSPPLSPRPMKSDRDDEDIKKRRLSTPRTPVRSYTPYATVPVPQTQSLFAPDDFVGTNGAQSTMHQPGQIAHPNMNHSIPGEDLSWKNSLCGCSSDVGTCLTGLFCPCVLYGKTAHRMSLKSEKKDPTDMLGWKMFNGQCCFMAAACGLWCLFPLIQRTRIRHMYKLEGSLASDIMRACCCCCCSVVQNEREIRDREESSRLQAGPANGHGYTSPPQMAYAPPPRTATNKK